MNRVFVTGDTHGHYSLSKLGHKRWKIGRTLSKDDYLIVLGDFGLLWDCVETSKETRQLDWLNEKKYTILSIDGNHENFNRLNKLEVSQFLGGKVGIIRDSIFHLKRGEIYTIGDKTFLTVGGARSYDKNNRIENISWWKEEELNCQEIEHTLSNLEKYNNKVDYILTHTLPESVFKKIYSKDKLRSDHCSVRKFLDHILSTVTFKKWYCGHWHEDLEFENFQILYHSIKEITGN